MGSTHISAAIDDITGFTAIEQITELQMAVAELYEIVGEYVRQILIDLDCEHLIVE